MSAPALAIALAAASAGPADDCPTIVASVDGTAITEDSAAIACLRGRMSQAVFEESEACISRFKGGVALRASLKAVPAYAKLDKPEFDNAEQTLLTDFAKMQGDPPDGVDLAKGRAAYNRAGAAAKAALSSPPAQRYALWREISPLTPRCMHVLGYRIGMHTVEQDRKNGG